VSQQNDIENVWEQLVGDAFTPAQPLPPPPEFAGAVDEEMQARASARLPLHVVPLSGPDSDALPIEVVERPESDTPAPRARKVDVVRRPQTEADAMAAPQSEVMADPVVEVDVRRRKRRLAPTMRTSAVPVDDELDVALFELARTGPHATVPVDEIVELDVGDLDIEELEADGRAVLDVDLVSDHAPPGLEELEEDDEDDSTVAGVIDLAEPSAAPRGSGDARASTRSAAIANAMRGATVRVPLVPERKVRVSVSSAPRGKASTVKTAAVALAQAEPMQMSAIDPVPMALVPAAMPVVQPTPPPLPVRVPLAPSSSSSSMMMRRVAVGGRVVAPRRGTFTWVVGAVVIALVGIGIAALTAGGGSKGPKPTPAEAGVVASARPTAPAEAAPPAIEPPAVRPADPATPANTIAPAPSDASARAPAPSVAPPQQAETEEPHREAGLAYVAAVERYEADHSNEAVEAMVSAACAMDDGPRARSAFRKLRGGDQRSRVMIACRDRGIDLWARVDGPTASELLVVAQRQLAEGDLVHALETARESNHVARNNGALLVMGIVECRLGNAEEAAELERHLPPRMRTELETACAGS
jgi:hypothetical protein